MLDSYVDDIQLAQRALGRGSFNQINTASLKPTNGQCSSSRGHGAEAYALKFISERRKECIENMNVSLTNRGKFVV